MKILGIHGRGSDLSKHTTWHARKIDLESRWHSIDIPQLDPCEDPTYEAWIKDLEKIDIESYDAIICVSHGSWVFARYVKENNLTLKRVVFCCAGRGSHNNTAKVYDYLDTHDMNLENNIQEIFIVHSTDDEHISYVKGQKFHKQIWGKFISLEWFPHRLDGEAIWIINNLATLWHTQKK